MPKLKSLVESGQVEMLTGGFYEPIMTVIPDRDKIGQIRKLTAFVKDQTGYTPEGMWLAERIWEPHLAKPIHRAGVKYVILDDSHFKSAGLRDNELFGYYITEEEGNPVYLFPISEKLRYNIPFRNVQETIDYLRSIATEDGDSFVVFADDGEKFGVWPDTYEHCYKQGWLEQFFQALSDNRDWIQILHFSEVLRKLKPLGKIYLPTASYREMMEWAMPTQAIKTYEAFEGILKEKDLHDTYKAFVRGGFWRNFMAKYPEANNMHKKMLNLSKRLSLLEEGHGSTLHYQKAQDALWAGQCNCSYWHGIFGGLYLNHLRFAIYRQFIKVEKILDTLEKEPHQVENGWLEHQYFDYDCDGHEDAILKNSAINLYFSPSQGGALYELDYKPKSINVLDTIMRREESYHQKLLHMDDLLPHTGEDEIASIHNLVIVKEEGLQNKLHYDWYRRSSLIDHFIAPETTLEQFYQSQYKEVGDFVEAQYEYSVEETYDALAIQLWRNGFLREQSKALPVYLKKKVKLSPAGSHLFIQYEIKNCHTEPQSFWFGVEFDFALLAGDAHDRYYVFPRHEILDPRLGSMGESKACSEVHLVDEWLGIRLVLKLHEAATVWRFPIETISQSESGFERVYQSSVVFPSWKRSLTPGASWKTEIIFEIEDLKRS
ncbi:MAG: alpha-amylase/4-alpha-glucanotransferase domain-containing protein [bacterium]